MRAIAILPVFLLAGCFGGSTILAEPGNCSSYIPEAWRLPVAPAPLPEGETIADWIVFADQQTGRLDVANGRMADSLHIIGECERRSAEAVKRSRRGLFGL